MFNKNREWQQELYNLKPSLSWRLTDGQMAAGSNWLSLGRSGAIVCRVSGAAEISVFCDAVYALHTGKDSGIAIESDGYGRQSTMVAGQLLLFDNLSDNLSINGLEIEAHGEKHIADELVAWLEICSGRNRFSLDHADNEDEVLVEACAEQIRLAVVSKDSGEPADTLLSRTDAQGLLEHLLALAASDAHQEYNRPAGFGGVLVHPGVDDFCNLLEIEALEGSRSVYLNKMETVGLAVDISLLLKQRAD